MKLQQIRPEFVDTIPRELEQGVLYISERFRTAVHKCACGCGEKVVTPLSPVHWTLRVQGNTVSLHPSIGNWNYACRSHYWIRQNRICWAGSMDERQIDRVQARDRLDQERYIQQRNLRRHDGTKVPLAAPNKGQIASGPSWVTRLWNAICRWFGGV